MVQRVFETLLLVSCLVALASAAFNYCSLCQDHIACKNNGQFAKECKNARMLKFSAQNIQTALRVHNEVRNKIAGGSEKRFQPATKMPVLKWDNELAYHAELLVRRCKFEHHGCIKSVNPAYRPGQNILLSGAQETDINKLMRSAIVGWYTNEVGKTDPKTMSGDQVGHFTQVVRDQCVAIGCAVSVSSIGTLLACNYSFGNIGGTGPVYATGKAASKCIKGRDSVFKNLCKA